MDRHFLHKRRPHPGRPDDADAGERARVLAELADGRALADVLDHEHAVVDAMPVRELLEALPGVDKIHAAQLTHALGIAERRTAGGLSDRQRQRLREAFPPPAAA
ncbi:integration host factor [Streptacidiphilus pinicola]|uniref:Integration host factor n=1 Tax=Streptacidiphilus pinicola TaxID=2219663 RepID=A0A2X0KDD8_9ACTN|nr:integration host factor [Streptacidiphilus pinicola]RAG85209.1 integration host factor [Streptacidiphilus pinicola]